MNIISDVLYQYPTLNQQWIQVSIITDTDQADIQLFFLSDSFNENAHFLNYVSEYTSNLYVYLKTIPKNTTLPCSRVLPHRFPILIGKAIHV